MCSASTDAGALTTDVVEDGLIAGSELTWVSESATEVEVELAVEPKSTGARMAVEVTTGSEITGANGWAMKVEVECAAGSKLTGASTLVMDVEVELMIKVQLRWPAFHPNTEGQTRSARHSACWCEQGHVSQTLSILRHH